jgi:hypothetical protein
MKKKRLVIIVLLTIVVLMGAFLIGKPIAIGYSTYQAVKSSNLTFENYRNAISDSIQTIESLRDEKTDKENLLLDCESKTKILEAQLSGINEQITSIQEDSKKELQDKLEQISLLNLDVTKAKENLRGSIDGYKTLAENAARIICCKMKIDNPKIDSYKISNDKILCNDNSGYDLKCSFS